MFLVYDQNVLVCDEILLAKKKIENQKADLRKQLEWFIQSKGQLKQCLYTVRPSKEKCLCTVRLRAYNISELQCSEMTDETTQEAPTAGLFFVS